MVLKLPSHSVNFISACGGLPAIIVYTFLQHDKRKPWTSALHAGIVCSQLRVSSSIYLPFSYIIEPFNPVGGFGSTLFVAGSHTLLCWQPHSFGGTGGTGVAMEVPSTGVVSDPPARN